MVDMLYITLAPSPFYLLLSRGSVVLLKLIYTTFLNNAVGVVPRFTDLHTMHPSLVCFSEVFQLGFGFSQLP